MYGYRVLLGLWDSESTKYLETCIQIMKNKRKKDSPSAVQIENFVISFQRRAIKDLKELWFIRRSLNNTVKKIMLENGTETSSTTTRGRSEATTITPQDNGRTINSLQGSNISTTSILTGGQYFSNVVSPSEKEKNIYTTTQNNQEQDNISQLTPTQPENQFTMGATFSDFTFSSGVNSQTSGQDMSQLTPISNFSFSVGNNTPENNHQQVETVSEIGITEKIIIKPVSASDNEDDMEDNDFDLDKPGSPGHGTSEIEHVDDPRCRPVESGVLQHSMLRQISPGFFRLACYPNEDVAISKSTIVSEDGGTMDGLFCNGTGHTEPATSRGNVQRKARLPNNGRYRYGVDDLICKYSPVRYPKGVLKTTFLDKNTYVWCNYHETIVIDGSALTSGHGGKANDALDDTKNNAVIIWINGECWLVATREIKYGEEICAAYGINFWKDHPNIALREKAVKYYASIQYEQDQQDREKRLSTKSRKKIQLDMSNQESDTQIKKPEKEGGENKDGKKRKRKVKAEDEGTPPPRLPPHIKPAVMTAGSRSHKKPKSSIECYYPVVCVNINDCVVKDDIVVTVNFNEMSSVNVVVERRGSEKNDFVLPDVRTAHDLASHKG